MVSKSFLIVGSALVAALVLAAGCGARHSSDGSTSKVMHMSMIPTTGRGKVIRDIQPLIAYLERETGLKIDLTVPTNYAAVVEAIANDRVDIAYLGGFTYVQASKRSGVVPLVQRERDRN